MPVQLALTSYVVLVQTKSMFPCQFGRKLQQEPSSRCLEYYLKKGLLVLGMVLQQQTELVNVQIGTYCHQSQQKTQLLSHHFVTAVAGTRPFAIGEHSCPQLTPARQTTIHRRPPLHLRQHLAILLVSMCSQGRGKRLKLILHPCKRVPPPFRPRVVVRHLRHPRHHRHPIEIVLLPTLQPTLLNHTLILRIILSIPFLQSKPILSRRVPAQYLERRSQHLIRDIVRTVLNCLYTFLTQESSGLFHSVGSGGRVEQERTVVVFEGSHPKQHKLVEFGVVAGASGEGGRGVERQEGSHLTQHRPHKVLQFLAFDTILVGPLEPTEHHLVVSSNARMRYLLWQFPRIHPARQHLQLPAFVLVLDFSQRQKLSKRLEQVFNQCVGSVWCERGAGSGSEATQVPAADGVEQGE